MSSIDVIIPCYNYGRYLRECVQSVLAQQGVDVRVLIIDDASSDDTPAVATELVASDARVSYRRHEKNLRHIATYNEGIASVTGKYYLLLSADDYVLPGSLRRAVDLMDSDPEMAFCYGEIDELYPDGTRIASRTSIAPHSNKIYLSMAGLDFIRFCRDKGSINVVPTPTAVVRVAVQRRTTGYRPELPHSADMELWLRLAMYGKVGFVRGVQAIYRRHTANMSLAYMGTNRLSDIRQRAAAIEFFYQDCLQSTQAGKSLRESLMIPLSYQALSGASAALNENRIDLYHEGSSLARQLDPSVIWTIDWVKLRLKRSMGRRLRTFAMNRRTPRPQN
jgi:GT2 family glycosyltransferase